MRWAKLGLGRAGSWQAGSWQNSHAIVTGGSSGIGAAVAAELAARSARVSLIARGEDALDATARRIGAEWEAADVSRSATLSAAVGALEARQGACDLLACCAGTVTAARFCDMTAAQIEQQMTVNYLGTVNAVRAVLPGMIRRSRGRVVLVSSTAALLGIAGYTGYAPTKAAVRQYAMSLRYELDGTGVAVSVVYPPDTDTPGFAAEVATRPPETAAVAGTIAAVPASRVAHAVVDGVERGRHHITLDPLTRFLVGWADAPENLARPVLRRVVARAREAGAREQAAKLSR